MSGPTSLQKLTVEIASAIGEVKSAFGAPGDHGYNTREGRALFELYKLQPELSTAFGALSSYDALQRDMLEALKEARQELYDDKHSHMSEDALAEWFADLDAVIAKAEGRS